MTNYVLVVSFMLSNGLCEPNMNSSTSNRIVETQTVLAERLWIIKYSTKQQRIAI